MKKIIFTLFVACLSKIIMAATYYVSNKGNDAHTGLSGFPWKTLARVNAAVFKAGDQILFERGGIFYGSFTIKQSGSAGNPITFGAYGTGANPVITGFTDVTAWSQAGTSLWESTNAISSLTNCNMVSINNVNTEMGRYPKSSSANGGYLTYQSHSGETSITSSDLTGTPNWTGAEVVIRVGAFHIRRSTVTSQFGGTLTFNPIGENPNDKNGFFFQNNDRCLTQQNDWRYNSTTKKIKVYSSAMPSGVKVASVENLITIDGNYLSISNITFTGANGCAIWKNPLLGYKSNVSITNCAFSYTGIAAIYVYINYLTVEGNTISESNNSAIAISSGTDNVIRNNTIYNIGVLKGMRYLSSPYNVNSAIDIGNSTRLTVEYNSIRNIGYIGISLWASNTVLIKNNFIDRYCTILDDGGAIYVYSAAGSACKAIKITGNICINGIGADGGSSFVHIAAGIHLDSRATNIELTHNTVANARSYGMFVASSGNIRVRHNTIYNSSEIQYYSVWFGLDIPYPTTSDTIRNNFFISKQKNSSADDSYQKCLVFYFTGANPTAQILASTALDSNCYARPVGDDKVLRASFPGNNCMTLPEWRSYYKQDAHSFGSPQSITDTSKLRFEYNNTKTARTVPLSKPMIDFRGTKYVGSITLQPYSSIVLMEDNNPPVQSSTPAEITSFTLPGQIGSTVINSSSKTIGVTMPSGASLTSLVASFTLSAGASVKVGSVVQVNGATANNYTSPVVYTVTGQNGTNSNNWTVTITVASSDIVSGGTYELFAKHSGKAIGIRGGSIVDNTILEQETYTGATSQQFTITDQGSGYYQISPVSVTSKALDVTGQSLINGTSIIQYVYFGGTNQQWKFVSMGGGYFQIVNRNSNKCLDVTNASTADGAVVQQYTCGTRSNQQFTFSRLKNTLATAPISEESAIISESNSNSTFSPYPNPSIEGNFSIDLQSLSTDQIVDINIYDVNGNLLYNQKTRGGNLVEINSGLRTGLFILKISYGQSNITKKLMVE